MFFVDHNTETIARSNRLITLSARSYLNTLHCKQVKVEQLDPGFLYEYQGSCWSLMITSKDRALWFGEDLLAGGEEITMHILSKTE